MAGVQGRKAYVFHGSYRQMQDQLDMIFKEMVRFERTGELDSARLEQALLEARSVFERWLDVTRAHADEADKLQLNLPQTEAAEALQLNPMRQVPVSENLPPFF